jgi:hypothetical protein
MLAMPNELADKFYQIYAAAQRATMPGFGKLQPRIDVMLANYRDIRERDYAHLAPYKKVKKRDAF